MTLRRTIATTALVLAAAFALSGCSGMMKKGDIPTDQNPAHDMHKSQGT